MTNKKTIAILFASMAVLLGATMLANPIALVNAQGNQTNQTTQTTQTNPNQTKPNEQTKVAVVTKIDVDPLVKALKDAYPKAADIKDDNVGSLKDLKDAKETAKTMAAANLLRDLMQFKALQDMQ
jgi:hypothetical protein